MALAEVSDTQPRACGEEVVPWCAVVLDERGVVTAAKLTGPSSDASSILGRSFDSLPFGCCSSGPWPEGLACVREVLAGGPEAGSIFPSGGRWLALRAARLGGPLGARVMVTVEDVTLRRVAEQHLEFTRFAMDQAPDAILWIGSDGRLEYANAAAETLLGCSAGELLRLRVWDVVADFTPEAWARQWANVRDNGRLTADLLCARKRGPPVPAETTFALFRFPDREICCAFARDVSARRRLEEDFLQAHKNEAAGRLASAVAHDFNNLLTVINGYSDLLLERHPEDHPDRALIREIHEAGQRAVTLTRQLLTFTRRSAARPSELDLNEVVGGFEKMLRRVLRDDVRVVFRPGKSLGRVRADAGQLEQAVMTMALNAREAMPGGGVLALETAQVEVDSETARCQPGLRPGDYVTLSVSDTGRGMDPEALAGLFEPRYTRREGSGAGLGLAAVALAARDAGGHVACRSEPGKGTTFTIYLPRLAGATAVSAAPCAFEAAPGGSVLLVDDEPMVRAIAAATLHQQGFRVLEAASGEEALRIAEAHNGRIDLLMTDLVMPGLSGSDLARRLVVRRPSVRVLVASGYSPQDVAGAGLVPAGAAYLQKPFTSDELVTRVRGLLAQPHKESA